MTDTRTMPLRIKNAYQEEVDINNAGEYVRELCVGEW